MSDWIYRTQTGRVVLRLLEIAAFFLGGLLTMWLCYRTEMTFFPVVEDWSLDYVVKEADGSYTVGGALRKERACELIAVNVLAVPKEHFEPRIPVLSIHPKNIIGGQIPTGFSQWGPWNTQLPKDMLKIRQKVDYLEVVGTHKCHAFWEQETVYGSIPMERLK